jgi:hypothetical protein
MSTPNWLATLEKLAPTVASAFGTPLAGMAVSALESALGATGVDAIQQKIESGQLTGDQVVAMKKADQDFAARMKELDIDLTKLQLADVADARAREVAVKDSTPRELAFMMISGFFVISVVILGGLIFLPDNMTKIPGPAWALIGSILTYLFEESGGATSYYFGTTQGSSDKNSTITKALTAISGK